MSFDRFLLSVAVLGLAAIAVWWVWALNRDTNRRIDTLAATVRNHSGSIVQFQSAAAGLPVNAHAEMPTVTKVTATISGDRSLQPHTRYDSPEVRPGGWARSQMWGDKGAELFQPSHALRAHLAEVPELNGKEVRPDPDETLRLSRPPSILPPEDLTEIEQALIAAGRPLTRNEIADRLGKRGWELHGDLAALVHGGKVGLAPSHSHELAYRALSRQGDTMRMAKMPVLPGTVA